jgi:PTS system ascorbate-specific IIB component
MAKHRIKIQTVCGVGMGSCVLIKMSIEKVAKEMGIPVEVEACDSSVAGGTGVDIIVTTELLSSSMGHLRNKHRIVIIKDFVSLDHIRSVLGPVLKEFAETQQ